MGEATVRYKLRASGLNAVDAPDETIILDEVGEKYFSANPAGSLLWKSLQDERSSDELADLLIQSFGIERSRAVADVGTFLDKLSNLDLIEEVQADVS